MIRVKIRRLCGCIEHVRSQSAEMTKRLMEIGVFTPCRECRGYLPD